MKVLLTGANGQVGQAIQRILAKHQVPCVALPRQALDISQAEAVMACYQHHQPTVVINAAAYTAVDKAEQQAEQAFAINALGPEYLAQACAAWRIPLVHFSTDYVFDGTQSTPYSEKDPANPQSVYGMSKWQGEQAIRATWPEHYIIRVSWVFGVAGANFVKTMLRLAQERDVLRVVADQYGNPTSAASIAALVQQLLPFVVHKQHCGTYHFSNTPSTTWHGFATEIVRQAQTRRPLTVQEVLAISTEDYPTPAKRPQNSVLNTDLIQQTFGIELSDWRQELTQVLTQL